MKSLRAAVVLLPIVSVAIFACSRSEPEPVATAHEEVEAIARTEFTDRIENFFEYEPLKAGKPSQFRIHLTDLTDGSPVEKANVSLLVRRKGTKEIASETTAKVGKVTGIYVAELNISGPGDYDIEFHIKTARLDERLPLSDFNVE
jgi:hypothetical protein